MQIKLSTLAVILGLGMGLPQISGLLKPAAFAVSGFNPEALYPGYGLAENMGYGSRDHLEALARRGPSEIHRRSFAGTQPWLDFGEA